MRWNYIIAGLLLLACGSYLDNCRGLLLPVITRDFQLGYSQSSWFFVAGNFGAVFATLALIPLTRHFSEKSVTLALTLIGGAGLLAGVWVSDFNTLMPFAVLVGSALAVYGALSNIYVIHGTELRHRSRVLCALHMVYGLASIVGPQLTGRLIERGFAWQTPILLVTPMLVFLAMFIFFRIPSQRNEGNEATHSAKMSRLQWMVVLLFCLYVAGEVLTSMWMVTFLVESKKLSVASSAKYLSGFFILMALTRALCFFSLKEKQESRIILASLVGSAVFFALGHEGNYWALSMAGVLGPFFPLLLARTSRAFPEQWKAMTLWILTSVQLTLALFHLFVGRITDTLGIDLAYWLPFALICLAAVSFLIYLPMERKRMGGLHPSS